MKDTHRHRLKHLSGNNDRLAGLVALRDHHLLRKEDLARGDFDTEITTRDHNTVGLVENLVKVGDTLLVLDLDDDLDVCTVGAEDLTDIEDILGATDEGRKDHVDAVLDTETEVVLVLLGQSGEVDIGLGQVDTLARRKRAVVQRTDVHVRAIDAGDEEGQDTWPGTVGRSHAKVHDGL